MTEETAKALFHSHLDEMAAEMGIPKHEAFPRWICENILGIVGESRTDEAVSIGGKSDYGVDIFHAEDSGDATEQYVCWVRAKFSGNLNHTVTREEMESFGNTLRRLRRCPDGANPAFRQKSAELTKMEAKNPRIKKRMIFAVTGRPNEQVRNMVGDENWKGVMGIGAGSNTRLEILDLDHILSRIVAPHTPPITLEFDGDVIRRKDGTTEKESVIGHVSAGSLVRLAKSNRDTLFLENPGGTLGSAAPTHRAICNTLNDAPPARRGERRAPDTHRAICNTLNDAAKRMRFWKMNNGITATCTRLEADGDAGTYVADNLKIVNGRQTLYTLENHPATDDVYLLMSVHQEADGDGRNEISEATNTQNPVQPADLVSNYQEMAEMVLQCRTDFRDFYFERQTKGFKSARSSTKTRVTKRRVLEKGDTARAYYAYEFDPNVAKVPDRVLFSTTSYPNYYDTVFRDRNVRDLIIPHIFMNMLGELHKRWCRESGSGDAAATRNRGIISKDIVKYYILRFISASMAGIGEQDRERIKNALISGFRALSATDPFPDEFLEIARAAYWNFIMIFDIERNNTWPQEVLEKIGTKKIKVSEDDKPTPLDVVYTLRERGEGLLPLLLMTRSNASDQMTDGVAERLLTLARAQD